MKLKLISKEKKAPKCEGCMGGRLLFEAATKTWRCCKGGGGWMWCLREYEEVKDDETNNGHIRK